MDTIYSSINVVSLVAAEVLCKRGSLSISAALQWESPVLNQINFSNGDKVHVVKVVDEPCSFRIYHEGFIPIKFEGEGLAYPLSKSQLKNDSSEALRQLRDCLERSVAQMSQKLYTSRGEPISESKDEPMPESTPIPDVRIPEGKPVPPSMKPPGFEDEYEIMTEKPQTLPSNPLSIGDRDLNPPGLPKFPEMKPFVDPLQNPTGEPGMHPTADHPLFRDPLRYDPPSVPPGARFDDPFFGGKTDPELVGAGLPGNMGLGGKRFRKPGFGGGGDGSGLGGPGSGGLGGGFGGGLDGSGFGGGFM